jgi:hypothetical protein
VIEESVGGNVIYFILRILFSPMIYLYKVAAKQEGDQRFIGLLIILVPTIVGIALGRNLIPALALPCALIFIYQSLGMLVWYHDPKGADQ